jgi:prevent-host-death family protein
VKTILVSEFKAKCIGILKEVQRSGKAVVVTLRGKPMVRVEPLPDEVVHKQLGALAGTIEVREDLVHADTTADWETEA